MILDVVLDFETIPNSAFTILMEVLYYGRELFSSSNDEIVVSNGLYPLVAYKDPLKPLNSMVGN